MAPSLQVLYSTRGAEGSTAPLEFNTGMDEVPEAVDMAVRLMTPQETSLVSAAARYAFDGRSERPQVRSRRHASPALRGMLPSLLRRHLTSGLRHAVRHHERSALVHSRQESFNLGQGYAFHGHW